MEIRHPTGIADALDGQKIAAVKCATCGRLHEFTSTTWMTLYGAWNQVQKPQRYVSGQKYEYTFGKPDKPLIVCGDTHCILKAMCLGDDLD